jgi:hypothetical protein
VSELQVSPSLTRCNTFSRPSPPLIALNDHFILSHSASATSMYINQLSLSMDFLIGYTTLPLTSTTDHAHRPWINNSIQPYMKKPDLQGFRMSTEFPYHQHIDNAPMWILNLKWLEQFRLRVDRFEYNIKGLEFLQCPRETVAAWKYMQGGFLTGSYPNWAIVCG